MINLPVTSDQSAVVVSIEQLTAEIVILKQQTAVNIIEIGRRLIQAKERIAHGEWSTWLRDSVEFSHQTANRFMQVATEFGNSSALRNLPITKVYALLEVPADQRDEFMDSPHIVPSGEVKTVDEMTTRELQQAIKEKGELRTELDTAKLAAKAIGDELVKERTRAAEEIGKLKTQLTLEQTKSTNAAAASTKVQQLETQLKEANEKVQRLQDEAKQPITLEPAIVERVPDTITRELDELREKAKSVQATEATLKFRVQFEALVSGFSNLLTVLDEVRAQTDDGTHAKYKGAIAGLISKMQERL